MNFFNSFTDKVETIREGTVNAPPPTFEMHTPSVLTDFTQVSMDMVSSLIMNASCKHSQQDPLPTWMVKKCSQLLVPYITLLVNKSLKTPMVPITMKSAVVTPLLKKTNLDPSNRSVSNQSILSQLLKRNVCNQLTSYLHENSLFSIHQ